MKFQEIEVVIFKLPLKIILKNYTTSGFLKTDIAAKNVTLATRTPKFYRKCRGTRRLIRVFELLRKKGAKFTTRG